VYIVNEPSYLDLELEVEIGMTPLIRLEGSLLFIFLYRSLSLGVDLGAAILGIIRGISSIVLRVLGSYRPK